MIIVAKRARKTTPPATPPSLPPERALDLLRRQVEKGQQLLANRPISSANDEAWETITRDVLNRAYGSQSPNVESVMGVGRYRNMFGGGNEVEWEEGRAENMRDRLTILAELISLLEHETGAKPTPPVASGATTEHLAAALSDGASAQSPVVVFVSYSWDNESHKNWVRGLADELIRNGIETILDQYELRPGHDRFRFMENSVRRADVVLCVCTPDYVRRANERQKGVGVETSLITPQFYEENKSKQFIPIIRVQQRGGTPTPDYMAGLIFVDFSNDGEHGVRMEELLRHLHRQPRFKKPPLGPVPNFGTNPST